MPASCADHPRRYLLLLLGTTGSALLAISTLNLLVDPFGVFGASIRSGVNDRTLDSSGFDRMVKPYKLVRAAPRTVLFGSSTAHVGFLSIADWDTALPHPAYNYALLGASAHEVRLSLAQALRECPVEAAILVADFFAFNAHYLDNPGFAPARLSVTTHRGWPGFLGSDLVAFTIGREVLGLSWQTLVASRRKLDSATQVDSLVQDYSWDVHFRNCERSYLTKWFPPPAHLYEFASTQTGGDRLADFDASLQLCGERGVHLIILCPPIHARFQEALAAAGAWPHYEAWKREIAKRTQAQQALRTGSGTVELWDFSLFNDLTCEPLPRDGAGSMRYFTDSAHFTQELGRLVLNEILDPEKPRANRPGVRLDRVEIESHLAAVRTGLEAFRAANPSVVADVRSALGIEPPSTTAPMASASPHR